RHEARGVVGRSGIEMDLARHGLRPPERPAEAGRAGVARRGPTAAAGPGEPSGRPLQGDRALGKGDEADMACAADALARATMAKTLHQGLALGAVAQGPAGTSSRHVHAGPPDLPR